MVAFLDRNDVEVEETTLRLEDFGNAEAALEAIFGVTTKPTHAEIQKSQRSIRGNAVLVLVVIAILAFTIQYLRRKRIDVQRANV